MKGCQDDIGVKQCLWEIVLIIGVGRPRPLQVAPFTVGLCKGKGSKLSILSALVCVCEEASFFEFLLA